MFNQKWMLLVAVVRDLLFPDIYPDGVMYLELPIGYSKIIAQKSMVDLLADIPLIGNRIDSFHRTTFDSVVITNQFLPDPSNKERRGTNLFNITQVNNFPVLVPMVLTNYEDLYIFRSFVLSRRKNDSTLVLLKRGSGTSTDLFNLELPPVKNLSDIKFFRGLGAHGYLAINNTVYILDMLADDQDCLKRVVKTLVIDPKVATFCPDGVVAGMSQVFSMVSYLWYLPASRDSFVSLILDIYGPTFPTSITIQDNSNKGPQFSLESTLMGQKRPISTIRQETKILTKSWLVAAAAIGKVDLRGNDPKNLTISLSDQIAIASDISNIKLVQPGPSIGHIRQAVRKTTNKTFNLSSIPDIIFSKSSTSYQHEQYLVYKNKTNLQVYNLNKYTTPENQGNDTIKSLLVDIKIDFVAENFDIDSISRRPSEVFMVALTEQSESGFYNLHVFVFPEADPSKYSKFIIPSACKCRTVRIELINTYKDILNYGLVHAELNELGNTIITSLLEVNRTSDPITKDFKYIGKIKPETVFQKYIRYRILDISMFSSENTLLLYYFIQNSGYMGIISLAFRDDGSLEKSRYRLSKMCNEFVVTRGSLIECKPREQELCLDCLFFSQHKMAQVHQLSLQFSLDDSNLMVPKHSPDLMLPTGYSVIKIKKAAAANIVLAIDEKTKEKCFLFFDSASNLVVQRMCTRDFEEVYADLKIEGASNFLEKLVTISEVSADTFIFAVEGMNLRDVLFNIGDYELVVDPNYFQGQSNYLGYHIDIENLSMLVIIKHIQVQKLSKKIFECIPGERSLEVPPSGCAEPTFCGNFSRIHSWLEIGGGIRPQVFYDTDWPNNVDQYFYRQLFSDMLLK